MFCAFLLRPGSGPVWGISRLLAITIGVSDLSDSLPYALCQVDMGTVWPPPWTHAVANVTGHRIRRIPLFVQASVLKTIACGHANIISR